MEKKYQVAAYYFPNFHHDPMNEKWHGKGWNEWNLLKVATPKFPGHRQPLVPLWGYQDESEPSVMEQKIEAAERGGVDAFIFDWYWYEGRKFLEKPLKEGYLKAKNNDKVKFALMWANHNWGNGHPASRVKESNMISAVISKTPEEFKDSVYYETTEYIIENYFTHPSYWKIDGKLYFSFYDFTHLKECFGGVSGVRDAIEDLRQRVREHGLGELHINMVIKARPILLGESNMHDDPKEIEQIGVDSVTSYCWLHYEPNIEFPAESYAKYSERCINGIKNIADMHTPPYIPNLTMGWDPSPRTVQSDIYEDVGYPFTTVLKDNTPTAFKTALEKMKNYLDENNSDIFTIYAWNEWTEGGYLEPDTEYGYGYLDAIKEVFKS